jgi:muramidase (phage lysozyme)
MAPYVSARSRRAKALMDTISGPESAGQYDRRYHPTGVRRFSDYSAHPNIGERIGAGPNEGKFSTAAGRYQITNSTWKNIAPRMGLEDFSPQSQDLAGWGLAQGRYGAGLDQDLASMDPATLGQVGKKLSKEWTSLPGGIEQQLGPNSFANSYLDSYANLAPSHPETTAQALTSPTPMANQYAPDAGMWSGPAKFGAPISVDAPDIAAGAFTQDTMAGALTPGSLSPMDAPMSAPPSMMASAPSPTQAEQDAAFGALRAGMAPNAASVQTQSMPGLSDAQIGMAMSPDDMRARIATAHSLAPGPNVDGTFGSLAGLGPTTAPQSAPDSTVAGLGMSPSPIAGPSPLGNFSTMPGATAPMSAQMQTATVSAPQQTAAPSAPPSHFGPQTMTAMSPMAGMPTMPGAISPMTNAMIGAAPQTAPQATVAAPQAQGTFGAPQMSAPAPMPMARPPGLMAGMPAVTVATPAALSQDAQQATAQADPNVSVTAGASSPADFARAMATQTAAKVAAVNAAGPEDAQSMASKIAGALGFGGAKTSTGGNAGMGGGSVGGSRGGSSSRGANTSRSAGGTRGSVGHGGAAQGSAHSKSSGGKRGTGAKTSGGR